MEIVAQFFKSAFSMVEISPIVRYDGVKDHAFNVKVRPLSVFWKETLNFFEAGQGYMQHIDEVVGGALAARLVLLMRIEKPLLFPGLFFAWQPFRTGS